MRNVLQRQDTFKQTLHLVRRVNVEKFFLLCIEIAGAQERVEALRDVRDARLNATGEVVGEFSCHLHIMGKFMGVQSQFEFVVVGVDIEHLYMDLADMHLKIYLSSLLSLMLSLQSVVSFPVLWFGYSLFTYTRSTRCSSPLYRRRDLKRYEAQSSHSIRFRGFLIGNPIFGRNHCFARRPPFCLRYTNEFKIDSPSMSIAPFLSSAQRRWKNSFSLSFPS